MAPDSPQSARAPLRGTVTLAALCLTTALAIALGSYLALCSRSYQLSTRQYQNELARELAQSGLEEALWALNQNTWTASGPAGTTAWATSGADRTATLDYGTVSPGVTGQVAVTIANYASAGPAWPTISAVATLTLGEGRTLARTQTAATAPAPLFGNAIASAEAYVSFIAGGTVDSWNSDPDNNPGTAAVAYSFTAGSAANHAAVVAGRDNGTHGVSLTQATVRGYVATFGQPVSYSVSSSPPGRVLGPSTPGTTNVDTARLGRTAFVPTTAVFTVNPPAISGPNYGGLINNVLALVAALLAAPPTVDVYKTSGDLTILGLPLLAPNLTVDRPLRLIVEGNLTVSGAGKITITPTGSLEIFVSGDVTIGGNGIDNQNASPAKCAIFSTSGSTADSLQYTTAQDFCGVIYCENKPIDIRQNATFRGALLSRSQVTFSTGATAPVFHYDTALQRTRFSQVRTPYVVARLTEP